MSIDFLIGALRASRDIPPTVMSEIEEILRKHEQKERPVVQRLGYPVKHNRRRRMEEA